MQLYAPPAVVLLCAVNGSGTRILCGSLTLTILAPLPASIFSKFVGENNASTAIGCARFVPTQWILAGPRRILIKWNVPYLSEDRIVWIREIEYVFTFE